MQTTEAKVKTVVCAFIIIVLLRFGGMIIESVWTLGQDIISFIENASEGVVIVICSLFIALIITWLLVNEHGVVKEKTNIYNYVSSFKYDKRLK